MTQQNKELEQARKLLQQWNKRRAAAEKKGLDRFYQLRELFRKEKTATR